MKNPICKCSAKMLFLFGLVFLFSIQSVTAIPVKTDLSRTQKTALESTFVCYVGPTTLKPSFTYLNVTAEKINNATRYFISGTISARATSMYHAENVIYQISSTTIATVPNSDFSSVVTQVSYSYIYKWSFIPVTTEERTLLTFQSIISDRKSSQFSILTQMNLTSNFVTYENPIFTQSDISQTIIANYNFTAILIDKNPNITLLSNSDSPTVVNQNSLYYLLGGGIVLIIFYFVLRRSHTQKNIR